MGDKNNNSIKSDHEDEPMSNHSDNPHFSTLLEKRLPRRQMLTGSLNVAVAGMFGLSELTTQAEVASGASISTKFAQSPNPPFSLNPTLGFNAIPITGSDTITIPFGYKAQALIPWGTPITGSYPAHTPDASNSGTDQEQQIGAHHDGMHYFPFKDNPNAHGLLAVNHEYVDQNVLYTHGPSLVAEQRPTDEVNKEIAAHGVSIVEINKNTNGDWQIINGVYNRRITADTPMEIRGPVRGSDLVKTRYSPAGIEARGTINNCGNGYTPWGTYLTCEENWVGYFANRTSLPREHSRYGVNTHNSRYRWETAQGGADEHIRFDASVKGNSANEDYQNEPNGHGWIVEIDPFNPNSKPIKRTAMGRFAHEGCWIALPQLGQPIVSYSGDDAQNEYIYKFVTKAHYSKEVNGDILDEGILYAASFNDDGTGKWLALDINDPYFQAMSISKGVFFMDQADVLVNTRLAADVVGATKMNRPEWGTVHPQTREVYMTLTNNSSRSAGTTDAANPRSPNPYGHIIRWREKGNRPWATQFTWDIFILGGPEADSQILPQQGGPA